MRDTIVIAHPKEDVSLLQQAIEASLEKSVRVWRVLKDIPDTNEIFLAVPRNSLILLPGWTIQLIQEDNSMSTLFLGDEFRKSFTCKEADYGIQFIK